MSTITQTPIPASELPLRDRLKRDIGMHRAAQVLADATRCQTGQAPLPLSQLDPRDREWFRQAARNIIEIFETVTSEREPDAVREQREMEVVTDHRDVMQQVAAAEHRARHNAARRGHVLDLWEQSPSPLSPTRTRARCKNCGRTVFVDITCDPPYTGMAIISGCLVAAESPR